MWETADEVRVNTKPEADTNVQKDIPVTDKLKQMKLEIAEAGVDSLNEKKDFISRWIAKLRVKERKRTINYILASDAKKTKDWDMLDEFHKQAREHLHAAGQDALKQALPSLSFGYDKNELNKLRDALAQEEYATDLTKLTALKADVESGKFFGSPAVIAKETTSNALLTAWAVGTWAAGWTLLTHEYYKETWDYIYPLPSKWKINSPFGPRDGGHHDGVDIAAPEGTPILSLCDGVVKHVWDNKEAGFGGYGNHILIEKKDGTQVLYAHLKEVPLLKVDDVVAKWKEIAKVGNTWESKGNHLHLEIRKHSKAVDPLTVMTIKKDMIDPKIMSRVDEKLLAA